MRTLYLGLLFCLIFLIPILVTVQFLALGPVVRFGQIIFRVQETSGIERQDFERLTRLSLNYLQDPQADVFGLTDYSAREVFHLRQVRQRFYQAGYLLAALVLLAILGSLGRLWRQSEVLTALKLTFFGNGCLGLLVVFGFPFFFEFFHWLLFTPGTYQFLADDLLIRLFPGRFWWGMFAGLIFLIEAENRLLLMVCKFSARKFLVDRIEIV